MPTGFDEDDDPPEEGTPEWRRAVLYSMFADEFRPQETITYRGHRLTRVDTPERVYTVHRQHPDDPDTEVYVTTLNLSGFKDTIDLARRLGELSTIDPR